MPRPTISQIRQFLGKKVILLLIISILIGFVISGIEISFVFILQLFLHALGLLPKDQLSVAGWIPTSVEASILLLVLFGIFRGFSLMVKSVVTGSVGLEFSRKTKLAIIKFSLNDPDKTSVGELITLYNDRTSQASSILQYFSQLVIVSTSTFLLMVGGFIKAPYEMLIGFFGVLILIAPLRLLDKRIANAGDGLRIQASSLNKIFLTNIKNNFLIKIYRRVNTEIDRSNIELQKYSDFYKSFYLISSIRAFTPNVIGIFVVCLITYFSLKILHTPGVVLITFFYLFIRISQGLSEMNSSLSEVKLFYGSFIELLNLSQKYDFDSFEDSMKPQPETFVSEDSILKLNVERLGFGFFEHSPLFQNISFEVSPGETLLIKGASGAGKSTLLKIILGLLKPSNGEISWTMKSNRRSSDIPINQLAYVGPDPYIFSGTVRENLCFGNDGPVKVDDIKLFESLKLACLDDIFKDLDFFLFEDAPISTGQKQRIAIARAILRSPKVLILDEATANLDAETERDLIKNVFGKLGDVLTIIISHKSTFDHLAKKIIEL